jgi:hypothetical protein
MKKEYDFSKAKRGAVIAPLAGKTRITIRIDDSVLEAFKDIVDRAGGGSYQALINEALREYLNSKPETLEATLRRVIRDELGAPSGTRATSQRPVRETSVRR